MNAAVPVSELVRLIESLRDEVRALAAKLESPKPPAERTTPYTAAEFAALIKRKPRFVQDRCATGRIKTMPGKPYRILPSERERWLERGGAR